MARESEGSVAPEMPLRQAQGCSVGSNTAFNSEPCSDDVGSTQSLTNFLMKHWGTEKGLWTSEGLRGSGEPGTAKSSKPLCSGCSWAPQWVTCLFFLYKS